ncbi:MAG: PIG-L family deacetylase [Candidatus Diapherotrites archaeon]|uniref:PIG-L family deacetylase n=1 Tax=Candidatus Iainarchaeum sp. TaxID=3101447 RepID=A0A8T4LB14_9ARCH|nr:PIG-L family deacetylase [Candidatus Diapherotrites archaeon]
MTKALVIVAHPDDETLWAGGLILSHPEWDWRIECLSRDWDTDRAPKFFRVVKQLGASGMIHGLIDDEPSLKTRQNIGELADHIEKFVGNDSFDYVFFHGFNGEYGHIRHRECHHAVKKLIVSNRLKTNRAYCFAVKKNRDKIAVPMTHGSLEVRLSRALHEKKKFLIHQVYGFSEDGFEVRSANKIERFRRIK